MVLKIVGTARALGINAQAVTTAEALKKHRLNRDIDLVFMDEAMPRFSGREVLAKIRATDASLPIILTSGSEEPGLVAQVEEDRSTALLRKPYRTTDLYEQVRKSLDCDRGELAKT